MTKREKFEEWAESEALCIDKLKNDSYQNDDTQNSWWAWQAATAVAAAWRPISEAPKDGSSMLLFRRDCPLQIGKWNDDRLNKKPLPYWDGMAYMGVYWMRGNQPTHFMPLPPPPK